MTTSKIGTFPREIWEREETFRTQTSQQDARAGRQIQGQNQFSPALHAALEEIGERFGLYNLMVQTGPVSPACLATLAAVPESAVRIWLEVQASGDYIYHAPGSNLYSLCHPWSPPSGREYIRS